jgi:hypothetical protein
MASMRPCEASSGTPAAEIWVGRRPHGLKAMSGRTSQKEHPECAMTDQSPIMRGDYSPDQRRGHSEPRWPHGRGRHRWQRNACTTHFSRGRAHSRAHIRLGVVRCASASDNLQSAGSSLVNRLLAMVRVSLTGTPAPHRRTPSMRRRHRPEFAARPVSTSSLFESTRESGPRR